MSPPRRLLHTDEDDKELVDAEELVLLVDDEEFVLLVDAEEEGKLLDSFSTSRFLPYAL